MVTPNETSVPSEVDSSPEVTDSLPVEDSPLIPADWDEQVAAVETATEEVTPSGDETTSDETVTQPEENSDQSEEIVAETEQTLDTPTEEAPKEGEQPEPRTYSQEERNNQEATYRKQFAEQERQVNDMQSQMVQMQEQYQNQLVDAEVRAYTSALETQYSDEGMDEGQAKARAQQELKAAKQDWLNTQENQKLRQQIATTEAEKASLSLKASVDHLMTEHGVPEGQRILLNGYTDPALAIEAAKALGAAEAIRKETIAARQAEVPNGAESGTFDSPAGASSGLTDAQWLDSQYNTGRSNDHERALKILNASGMNPL
jgi:hypothetical protein